MWKELFTNENSSLIRLGIRALRGVVGREDSVFPEPKHLGLSWSAQRIYGRCKEKAGEWIKDYSLFEKLLLCNEVEKKFFWLVLTEYACRDWYSSSRKNGETEKELMNAFSAAKKSARERYCQKLGKDPDDLYSQDYFIPIGSAAQFIHMALIGDFNEGTPYTNSWYQCESFRLKIQIARNNFLKPSP